MLISLYYSNIRIFFCGFSVYSASRIFFVGFSADKNSAANSAIDGGLVVYRPDRIALSGGHAIRWVCYLFVVSFCDCVQDYCKSNQPTSYKLGVMSRPTNRKNWWTFGGDPVQETDSGWITFHFPRHCGIGDFSTFISISHTVADRFSRHSAKWLTPTR